MAAKSKLKKNKSGLNKAHKDSLLRDINAYANALAKAAKWATSDESVAYVKNRDDDKKGVNYIFEFYCYIRIAKDLLGNYTCKYVEGTGPNKHKFPQASANKAGKPKFIFFNNPSDTEAEFQLCAGVKINGKYVIEKDHPDISFQIGNAGDDPGTNDLIMVFDAKFQLVNTSNLKKGEVDKFESIVRRLNLNTNTLKKTIKFNQLKGFEGNCLLTNVKFHHPKSADLDNRLKKEFIKEVQQFYPGLTHSIAG